MMTWASPRAKAGSVPGRITMTSSPLLAVEEYSTVTTTTWAPFMRASVSQWLSGIFVEIQLLPQGVTRRSVRVPGVVVPPDPALGPLGAHAPHLGVEERQHVTEPVEAAEAQRPEERHPAAHLQGAGPRPFGPLPPDRVVALGQEELLARLARIRPGDG